MNGDYSIFNNSMNGTITLSDGVSFISDGQAQHENIIYTNFIKSEDELTTLTNNSLTTVNLTATNLTSTNISGNSGTLGSLTLTNLNVDNYGFVVDGFGDTISSSLPTTMNNTLKIVGNEFTIENGNINQIGTTSLNTLKTTSINGSLTCQSDLIQTGGNSVLKNITCDNITMNSNKSITQSGSGITNSLGTTTISNLTITTSMTFPASVSIPEAEQTGDLTFTGGARIIQDLTEAGTNYNTFMYSKIAKADFNGNITQSSGTATLLNTTIEGTAQIQGDITQTAGQCVLKAIGCDQISLNANKDLFFSNGTGKIDQSVSSGTNILDAITMNANRNITQSGTGILSQSGTGTNALKSLSITGTLAVSSSSTFTGNVQCDGSLTMGANRSITQPTGTTNNQFQTTSITNLTCPTATITDITATTLAVGNVSNTEIQYLDGVSSSIQTQIDNINSTTSGNSASLTGINYTLATDTTTISNNVVIPTGKTLSVGSISDVATNIGTLNTSVSNIDTSLNTLTTSYNSTSSGITYNSGTDTTTIDNNMTVNKTLIVQGMNIKAEIDALESSFTTGTLNSTSATIADLNSTNINASYIVSSRYLRTLDTTNSTQSLFFQSNYNLYYDNQASNSHHIFATYTSLGAQVIPLFLNATSAFFNVAITCANIIVNTLATIASMIVINLTASNITSPTTGNLSITTASGRDLLLNNNKSSASGDVRINTSSTNSNVFIDNGSLTVSSGNLSLPYGIITADSATVSVMRCDEIYPLPFPSTTDRTRVRTNFIADTDRVITSPSTYFGAYFIDAGLSNYKLDRFRPIPCSVAVAGETDDIWIVSAGYKLVLYRYSNYGILAGQRDWAGSTDISSQTRTIDNTSGTDFICISSIDIYGTQNQVGSCKLYYQNNEITLPYIS